MTEPFHFDMDYIIGMMTKQKRFCDDCKAKLDILTLYMQDLTSTDWKAPAALEFKADIEQWAKAEYQWIENILEISTRVTNEMVDWDTTASHLAP